MSFRIHGGIHAAIMNDEHQLLVLAIPWKIPMYHVKKSVCGAGVAVYESSESAANSSASRESERSGDKDLSSTTIACFS
jgi:hypothetical protein